ncbi:MAG TPA: helix-turn-helix transcriptional regulator [Candidatus Eisenbergiella merdipullorum]|uniref:Helix-turn-helix transcriptional regulator n=1 Tax=Candidatus Eisenbergiella merdipullorum TaxID=2838553 RepID=A0A9D2I903_9FIRM|nr:helix-turn-helix transcriptional regulator [Candidatus Eisenbergiella merdipullorum]
MMIGDRIKQLRTDAKMTQPELAAKLEVTRSAIATYENNTRQPSFHVLVRIAEIFHVSTDYLLLGNKNDLLDVSGLTVDQKMILTDLIKNFKESNESILFELTKKKELLEKNRELEKRLKDKE